MWGIWLYDFVVSAFASFQIINVLTNDGYRMFEAVIFGTFVFCLPLLLIICVTYACYILDYTALIGVLAYAVFIPVQVPFTLLPAPCDKHTHTHDRISPNLVL